LVLGTSLPISSVEAAQDGTLGATSTGSTDMDVTIPGLVRITGVGNLDFGNYTGGSAPSLYEPVCVYTNDASGNYKVTARGTGASYAFTVDDGNGHTIPYSVSWDDFSATISLSPDTASTTRSGANTSSQTCGGGNSARFQVSFTASALLSKPAGTYTGTLTLIIEPS
jgi:hypothetical protein